MDKIEFEPQVDFTPETPSKPSFYELEKQPGLPKTSEDIASQVIGGVTKAITSPFPTSELTMIPNMLQQASQQLGPDVARLAEPSMGPFKARAAGFAAQIATDPTTYVSGGIGKKAGTTAAEGLMNGEIASAIKSKVPGLFKILANVPEQASETLIANKGVLPKATQEVGEAVTAKVQNALEKAVQERGAALNEAKSSLGLPVTADEKIKNLKDTGNIFGINTKTTKELKTVFGPTGESFVEELMKPADITNPTNKTSLINAIEDFKAKSSSLSEPTRVKTAAFLQDKINNYVNWDKPGDQIEGLLKTQFDDLKSIGVPSSLQSAKTDMSEALNLSKDLEKKIGQDPGKAYDFLHKIFTSDSGTAKDYIKKLADLETVSGEPILTNLKNYFASLSFSKYASRPGLEVAETAGAANAALRGHLGASMGMLSALAAQSPKALKGMYSLAAPAIRAAGASTGFPLGIVLNEMSKRALQSAKDKLNAK